MLDTGVHATLEDLARAKGVAPTYVSRILRLTLLAPEIVEAILDGRQPAELQLDDLLEGFPLEWEGQRKSLLFEGSNLRSHARRNGRLRGRGRPGEAAALEGGAEHSPRQDDSELTACRWAARSRPSTGLHRAPQTRAGRRIASRDGSRSVRSGRRSGALSASGCSAGSRVADASLQILPCSSEIMESVVSIAVLLWRPGGASCGEHCALGALCVLQRMVKSSKFRQNSRKRSIPPRGPPGAAPRRWAPSAPDSCPAARPGSSPA